MIGQKQVLSTISKLIENNTFPRFLILVGPKGSGKKTLCQFISNQLNTIPITIGVSVAEVRTMIETCHKMRESVLHIIPDGDTMSNEAKNAMLKVIEEPPNNAYFIMTLQDINNTLATVKSRAYILNMDRYTPDEIVQYAERNGAYVEEFRNVFKQLCDTPGEVELLENVEIKQFYDYVELVIDNITDVGTANALKIGEKVSLKDNATGYDLKLFWKAFIDICIKRAKNDNLDMALQYAAGASITSKCLSELRIRGVNRQMLFLDWILRIRKEWN